MIDNNSINNKSRRLQVGLVETDEKRLNDSLRLSLAKSKNEVIRFALEFLHMLYVHYTQGVRVVFKNSKLGRQISAIIPEDTGEITESSEVIFTGRIIFKKDNINNTHAIYKTSSRPSPISSIWEFLKKSHEKDNIKVFSGKILSYDISFGSADNSHIEKKNDHSNLINEIQILLEKLEHESRTIRERLKNIVERIISERHKDNYISAKFINSISVEEEYPFSLFVHEKKNKGISSISSLTNRLSSFDDKLSNNIIIETDNIYENSRYLSNNINISNDVPAELLLNIPNSASGKSHFFKTNEKKLKLYMLRVKSIKSIHEFKKDFVSIQNKKVPFEILLHPNEESLVDNLLKMLNEKRISSIVRQAIRNYHISLDLSNKGWELAAITCNKTLMLHIPGVASKSIVERDNNQYRKENNDMAIQDDKNRNILSKLPPVLSDRINKIAAYDQISRDATIINLLWAAIENKERPVNMLPANKEFSIVEAMILQLNQEWNNVVVCIHKILDDKDFFPVLIKHLLKNTKVYYIHDNPNVLSLLIKKINDNAPHLGQELYHLLGAIIVSKKQFKEFGEFVILNLGIGDRTVGYRWNYGKCKWMDNMEISRAYSEFWPKISELNKKRRQFSDSDQILNPEEKENIPSVHYDTK